MKRESAFDYLKMIAIIFVVIYHCTEFSFQPIQCWSFKEFGIYSAHSILAVCVPIFYLVNGYFLFKKEFSFKKHINKILHLVIILVSWSIIRVIALMIITQEQLSFFQIFTYALTLKKGWTNTLWFIGTLIGIYFIFPILKVSYDKDKKVFLLFLSGLCVSVFGNSFLNQICTIGSTLLGHPIILENRNFFYVFGQLVGTYGFALSYFCLGGIITSIRQFLEKIKWKYRMCISIFTIICCSLLLGYCGSIYSFNNGELWDLVWNGYSSVFTLFNVIAIYNLVDLIPINSKFVRIVGSNTMGIYLIHDIVGKFIVTLCPMFSRKIYIVPNTICIFLISIVITELISKNYFIKKYLL